MGERAQIEPQARREMNRDEKKPRTRRGSK